LKKIIYKLLYPLRWISIKLKKLLNYFYNENKIGRFFIVFIPSFLLILLGAFIIFDNFQTASKDTTYLTNYGFAILIGIASICFSWARNMNIEIEPLMISRVNIAGENSFHSAILFLIASGIKHSLVNLETYVTKQWFYVQNILHLILYIIFLICFTIAYIKFEAVIRDLNFLLYDRLNKKLKN
jgi:hypothetical protein